MKRRISQRGVQKDRRGTATVEFALTAPMFLTLVLGIIEMTQAMDVSSNLTAALREGGRLATMDYSDAIPSGMTTNDKIILDIRNMLNAAGIPGDDVTITITHANGALEGQPFNIDDPANYLKYFKIYAEIDFDDVDLFLGHVMNGQKISSSLVFRLGRVSLDS